MKLQTMKTKCLNLGIPSPIHVDSSLSDRVWLIEANNIIESEQLNQFLNIINNNKRPTTEQLTIIESLISTNRINSLWPDELEKLLLICAENYINSDKFSDVHFVDLFDSLLNLLDLEKSGIKLQRLEIKKIGYKILQENCIKIRAKIALLEILYLILPDQIGYRLCQLSDEYFKSDFILKQITDLKIDYLIAPIQIQKKAQQKLKSISEAILPSKKNLKNQTAKI